MQTASTMVQHIFQTFSVCQQCAAEDVVEHLASCGLHEANACLEKSFLGGYAQQSGHKRSRGIISTTKPSGTHLKALKSMAAVMEIVNFTDEHLDVCKLRCGVGGLVPARQAVRKLFRGAAVKMSGTLPLEVLRCIFSQAIETVDQIVYRWTETKGMCTAPLPHLSHVL
jgi:hypothetical protein